MISRIRILKALLSYTRKDDLITLASALSCTFSVISSRNVSKIMSGLQPYLVLNDAKRPQRPQPQPQVRHNGHLSPLLIRHTVINMYPVCTVNNANHEFYSQPSIHHDQHINILFTTVNIILTTVLLTIISTTVDDAISRSHLGVSIFI